MAGEQILIADDNISVQEIAKNVLEEEGFKVTVASNGMAALSHPHLMDFDLIIVDEQMDGMDGLDTTRYLRTDPNTHGLPVLLLVPEEQASDRMSKSLKGARGYIVKPFKPTHLAMKVKELLDEHVILNKSREHLEKAADDYMDRIAQEHIQSAVERKTQIIVERTIQNVISLIDQQARRQVEEKVTTLTSEKEQQLVKMTVHEVAQSMVEKLAERKVSEASESILRDETEKSVKRVSDTMLPGLIRERVKESVNNILPREVENEVSKAAQTIFPDEAGKFLKIVDEVAKKNVPAITREMLPPLIESRITEMAKDMVPRIVQEVAANEVQAQMSRRVQPAIDSAVKNARMQVFILFLVLAFIMMALVMGMNFFMPELKSLLGGN